MELEMCQYIDWELNFEPDSLKEFEDTVWKDFARALPHLRTPPTISKLTSSTVIIKIVRYLYDFAKPHKSQDTCIYANRATKYTIR